MRELKFRAWDKSTNTMSAPFCIFDADIHIYRDWELMQYTGLKDKKGMEIYEGYVVRISDNHIEVMNWVGDGDWMGDKQPLVGFVHHSAIYKRPIEVIGNIYENPELLTNN